VTAIDDPVDPYAGEPDSPPHPADTTSRNGAAPPLTRAGWELPRSTLRVFLDEPEPEYDWLIPGLLERGDRCIVTAGEGRGKSTLLRQIGVQVSKGIHPFTLDPIPPVRVALLDLENSRRHVRRKLRPLALTGPGEGDDRFIVSVVPEGIDLMHDKGRLALDDLIAATGPDLVIVGPLYKLASGDPKDEEQARAVSAVIDGHRGRYGCTFLIEAHQPYPTGGSRQRPLRPYGASLWSRWPEFGLALTDRDELLHWRGARDERQWPAALKRGGEVHARVLDAEGVAMPVTAGE
jgi:hypothetical protein